MTEEEYKKAKQIIKDLLADNTDWTNKLEAEQFLKGEDIILEDDRLTKAVELLTKVMKNTWSIDCFVVKEIEQFLKE